MAMNFPADPTVGQEFPYNDFIYVWDGNKWTTKVVLAEDTDPRYVNVTGDLMTGPLTVQSFGNRYVALQTNVDYARVRFGHPSNGHGYGMVYAYSEAGGDYISFQQYDVDGAYVNEPWTYLPSTNQFEMQNPHSKSAQGTAGNALVRKDYLDGGFVKKTGDTMTGMLALKGASSQLSIKNSADKTWDVEVQGDGVYQVVEQGVSLGMSIYPNTGDGNAVRFNSAVYSGLQGQTNDSLTRKDYVDNRVNNSVFNTGTGFDQTVDWNNFGTPGVWRFGSTDGVSFGPNGPSGSGYAYGTLVVFVGATGITQCYYPHSVSAKPAERTSFDNTSSFTPWRYTYHTSAPPTALEVGALSPSGDTMFGDLILNYNGGSGSISINPQGDMVIGDFREGGSMVLYKRDSEYHTNPMDVPQLFVREAPTQSNHVICKDYHDATIAALLARIESLEARIAP